MTKKNETIKYLIIGNSAGGIGAAEAIREVDKAGTITIVSDEPYPAYSRPLISEHLADGRPLERILFRPPGFYDNNHIQTILGQKVVGVKPEEHSIELDDGRLITWEKLLLATGGLPIVPPMEGLGLKGIFTFTTLDDARAVDHFLRQHPKREIRAVVIGGGLIGISATEALLKRGVEVTIIEMKDRVLNAILDEEASSLEEDALRKARVEIITGHTVSRITSYVPGEVTGVTLDNSRPLACEMVIVAIGVRPRTELVSDTGIKTNRGIIIDRRMTTSNPDVYACGDVAEGYDFVHGENRLSPVWPNAYLGGRIAGFNMAGVPTEYRGGTAMNSMKYFGVNIHSAGMVAPTDDSYEVISSKTAHTYKKVILKDGLITGMVYSSDIEKSGIVYRLMKDRINVEAFKQELVAADFGLVSLPEELWKPQLSLPSSETSAPGTPAEEPEEALVGE